MTGLHRTEGSVQGISRAAPLRGVLSKRPECASCSGLREKQDQILPDMDYPREEVCWGVEARSAG